MTACTKRNIKHPQPKPKQQPITSRSKQKNYRCLTFIRVMRPHTGLHVCAMRGCCERSPQQYCGPCSPQGSPRHPCMQPRGQAKDECRLLNSRVGACAALFCVISMSFLPYPGRKQFLKPPKFWGVRLRIELQNIYLVHCSLYLVPLQQGISRYSLHICRLFFLDYCLFWCVVQDHRELTSLV